MDGFFNFLPTERLLSMLETAKLKLKSRTGFIVNKLKKLQQQGVPYETAMSNPEIVGLLKDLQTTREALHFISGVLKTRG